jgi:hypothetical protein
MGKKFNTVEEVTSWKKFIANGQTYDLSHLDAHWVEPTFRWLERSPEN